jgi:hypothetical protein
LNELRRVHLLIFIVPVYFKVIDYFLVKLAHIIRVLSAVNIFPSAPHFLHEVAYLSGKTVHCIGSSEIVLSELLDIAEALECAVDETGIAFIG